MAQVHNIEPDFRVLFESVPGLYLALTPSFRIVAVSDAYLQATMTRREEILGRDLFEVFPDNPNDPGATGVRNLHASLQRAIQNRRPDAMAVQKYDIRRPDSEGGEFEERYWSPVNCPVMDASGEILYVIHRVEDVTDFVRLKQHGVEREKMTEELRIHAERKEAEIFLRARELAEANRQLREANDELGRLYRQIVLLMAQADDELRAEAASESRSRDGRISPEEMLRRVGQLIAGRRRMEQELRQAHKMEAIGRLAGGVAHDFNNLLTVISGYADLVRMDIAEGHLADDIDEIKLAAERAGELTKQLLAFSRKQVLQPRLLDLNEVVGGMERMVRRLIGEDIALVTVLTGGLAKVKADRGQVEQVIMNLVVNARDAMPHGGRLVLETHSVGTIAEPRMKPGQYIGLKVTDSGVGMDAETIARIFEPFYTTKAVGKGTGLGLATVYGIVEQSGGTVQVVSQPGQGTTFEIYFPEAPDQAEAENDRPRGSGSARAASVLVVEDEGSLRRLVCTVLERAKYDVLEAANAEEGLILATQVGRPIDLLLTDVIMPGMSGPELYEQLRRQQPDLLVLFLSGYDRDLIGDRHSRPGVGFLPKPFTPPALLAKVSEFLGLSAEEGSEDISVA